VVRRLKEDVRELFGGFPKREVVQIDVSGLPESTLELELSRLLDEYRHLGYPGEIEPITPEEVAQAIELTERAVTWARVRIYEVPGPR
jgi:hypothetical protein